MPRVLVQIVSVPRIFVLKKLIPGMLVFVMFVLGLLLLTIEISCSEMVVFVILPIIFANLLCYIQDLAYQKAVTYIDK